MYIQTMPKSYKVNACLTLALAVVSYLFFQLCKQQPALERVATFTEDPYDAVGSFGALFVIFTALLALIRAFRPYQKNKTFGNQQVLFVRGTYFTCLAVAVTLGADIVAMMRFPSAWIGTPAGYTLVALVAGMALLTTLVGWRIHHTTRETIASPVHNAWVRAIVISVVGAIVCALYPQNWHDLFPIGGLWTVFILFTVVVGMTIFFTSTWAWGMAISPPLETPAEDFIDDLAALYRWFKAHIGPFSALLTPFERALASPVLRPILNWMNPRNNRWYGIALIGIGVGVFLALGEGHLHPPPGLLAVFAGFGCLGVLMGYAFFVKPLGLVRTDQKQPTPTYR